MDVAGLSPNQKMVRVQVEEGAQLSEEQTLFNSTLNLSFIPGAVPYPFDARSIGFASPIPEEQLILNEELEEKEDMIYLAHRGVMSVIFEKLSKMRQAQLHKVWKQLEWRIKLKNHLDSLTHFPFRLVPGFSIGKSTFKLPVADLGKQEQTSKNQGG